MTRRRFSARPVVWIVFAILVGVPSVQLTRLLREERASVQPAGEPRSAPAPAAADDSRDDAFRYEHVGPSTAPIAAAAISPSGRLVAVLDDSGEVTIWDVKDRRRVNRFDSGHRMPVRRLYPSAAPMAIEERLGFGVRMSLLALGGNDGRFSVWQAATGDRVMSVPHEPESLELRERGPLVDAEINLDGGALSVSSGGSVAFWRGRPDRDSALVWISQSPSGRVRDVDISPDNRTIAVAGERAVYFLNPHPGQQVWTALDATGGEPQRVLFSPGGGLLATVWSDGEIRLYSVASRERVRTMRVGEKWVPALLAFSPDGQQLAATDGHRVIQIWAMRQGSTPVALTAPRMPIQSLWFTADGQNVVVSGRGDRYLRSLPVPVEP